MIFATANLTVEMYDAICFMIIVYGIFIMIVSIVIALILADISNLKSDCNTLRDMAYSHIHCDKCRRQTERFRTKESVLEDNFLLCRTCKSDEDDLIVKAKKEEEQTPKSVKTWRHFPRK